MERISQNHVWQLILAFRIESNFSGPVFNIGGQIMVLFFSVGRNKQWTELVYMYISSEINDLSVDINDLSVDISSEINDNLCQQKISESSNLRFLCVQQCVNSVRSFESSKKN